MVVQEEIIKEIAMYFAYIESLVKFENSISFVDINISLETLIMRLVNEIFDYKFENCNYKKVNFKNIDLVNEDKMVGIQITSDVSAKKIKDTLEKEKKYKVIFFHIKQSLSYNKKTFEKYSNFNLNTDIIDFCKYIKIARQDESKLRRILEILKSNILMPINEENWAINVSGYGTYMKNVLIKELEEVKERFIPTSFTFKCIRHLEEKNLLVIIGNPGVGKSYNSKFLVSKYIEQGYKILYSPNKNLTQILEQYNDSDKYVVFVDDIFGANNLEFMKTINEEELVALLKINPSSKVKVIINSRTSIYMDVKNNYEKVKNLGLKPYILETDDFSMLDKARIFIKHLALSGISAEYQMTLFKKNEFFKFIENTPIYKIINHKNYNPRIIEFITKQHQFDSSLNYADFALNSLNKPTAIYENAYLHNLNSNDRVILQCIYWKSKGSPNNEVEIQDITKSLKRVCNLENEIICQGLYKLEKSFIIFYINESGQKVCKFYNPSIFDFCNSKFSQIFEMEKFIDIAEKPSDLDVLLPNKEINYEKKRDKIIELQYCDFKILNIMLSEFSKDDKMKTYIEHLILDTNSNLYFADEFFASDFIDSKKLVKCIQETDNIKRYTMFHYWNLNSNLNVLIINNKDKFDKKTWDSIIKEFINQMNAEIFEKVLDSISQEINSEDQLYEKYQYAKDEIIDNLVDFLENDSVNIESVSEIIESIDGGISEFDYSDYDETIKDVMNDNGSSTIITMDENKQETCILINRYEKELDKNKAN